MDKVFDRLGEPAILLNDPILTTDTRRILLDKDPAAVGSANDIPAYSTHGQQPQRHTVGNGG